MTKSDIVYYVSAVISISGIIGTVWFAGDQAKKQDEFRSSQKAALDSLLKHDSIHVICTRCNWDNKRSLFWVRDSTFTSVLESSEQP